MWEPRQKKILWKHLQEESSKEQYTYFAQIAQREGYEQIA